MHVVKMLMRFVYVHVHGIMPVCSLVMTFYLIINLTIDILWK